ncbi:hypothetical protein EJ08DRAFT_266408 [Tothia fuscella]|uniref:Uncharacterized protein n=1 Tax=Tothia fuscella TaxID=1048955 RepID=A0A9P4NQP7_9PEZI|nr:hypothetical protein EJ08DRAFT_266408 [Tothia fuscella]
MLGYQLLYCVASLFICDRFILSFLYLRARRSPPRYRIRSAQCHRWLALPLLCWGRLKNNDGRVQNIQKEHFELSTFTARWCAWSVSLLHKAESRAI